MCILPLCCFVLFWAFFCFVKQRFSEIGWYRLLRQTDGKSGRTGGWGAQLSTTCCYDLELMRCKRKKTKWDMSEIRRSSACYVASTVMQHRDNKGRWLNSATKGCDMNSHNIMRMRQVLSAGRWGWCALGCTVNYISDVPMKKKSPHLIPTIKMKNFQMYNGRYSWTKATPSKSLKGQVTFMVVWRNSKGEIQPFQVPLSSATLAKK